MSEKRNRELERALSNTWVVGKEKSGTDLGSKEAIQNSKEYI